MAETSPRRRAPRLLAIAAAAVVALVAVLLLVADSIVTRAARKEALELSSKLGRPVEVGRVAATLFTGLGADVTDFRVGPAPGEGLPLLEVPRASVRVSLLRALFSLGRDIEVRSAVVSRPRVNLLRFPDGTTNLERLQRKLAAAMPAKPGKELAPEKPADLSRVRVGRAAIEDGRIALVDRSVGAARELYLDHLDVEVRDVRAGEPLEVAVKAAVLAQRQNLELRLKAAPLPPTLVPTPQQVTLKVEPIDLAPIGPFLPSSVGLRGGTFQADLDAALGAAVPGGSGPTRVKGGLRAGRLAFAGQEGGRALDVALDADLDGDAGAGDLRIRRLRLDFGPAGLTGKGSVSGLAGGSPRVEGLEIAGHGLDAAALAPYFPALRQLAARVSGPAALSLRAAGTAAEPALELSVDLGPVRLAFPGALSKAPGAKALLVAHAAARGAGGLRFDADADLSGLDLRPGGSLNKGPGDRLEVKLAGSRQASGNQQTIELSRLEVLLPGGDAVAGKATVVAAGAGTRRTTRFEAEARSSRLDLDRLLLPPPKETPKKSPPLDPKSFAGLSGKASVRVDALRYRKSEMREVLAQIEVKEDQVTLTQARLTAFGGRVSADGTRLALAHPDEPFRIAAQLQGIEVGEAVGLFAPGKVVSGKFDGKVDLSGGGTGKPDLASTLAGILGGQLAEGAFHGKDLVAGVAGPLAKALPGGLGKQIPSGGGSTPLGKNLPFSLKFRDGVAELEKPLRVSTSQGDLSLGGGFRVDGTLDMAGTVSLAPQTVASLTGGRVRPQAAIPVTFKMTGPAWRPSLGELGLQPAVNAIAREAGSALLGKVMGAPGGAPAPDKQKAEGEAKQKAEMEAKQRLEEEAKKRLRGLFK